MENTIIAITAASEVAGILITAHALQRVEEVW
jgi:hypothetical protein